MQLKWSKREFPIFKVEKSPAFLDRHFSEKKCVAKKWQEVALLGILWHISTHSIGMSCSLKILGARVGAIPVKKTWHYVMATLVWSGALIRSLSTPL